MVFPMTQNRDIMGNIANVVQANQHSPRRRGTSQRQQFIEPSNGGSSSNVSPLCSVQCPRCQHSFSVPPRSETTRAANLTNASSNRNQNADRAPRLTEQRQQMREQRSQQQNMEYGMPNVSNGRYTLAPSQATRAANLTNASSSQNHNAHRASRPTEQRHQSRQLVTEQRPQSRQTMEYDMPYVSDERNPIAPSQTTHAANLTSASSTRNHNAYRASRPTEQRHQSRQLVTKQRPQIRESMEYDTPYVSNGRNPIAPSQGNTIEAMANRDQPTKGKDPANRSYAAVVAENVTTDEADNGETLKRQLAKDNHTSQAEMKKSKNGENITPHLDHEADQGWTVVSRHKSKHD